MDLMIESKFAVGYLTRKEVKLRALAVQPDMKISQPVMKIRQDWSASR